MAKPVILDNFSWPTQSKAEAAFQDILKASGYATYARITDPVHNQMLHELLDIHPKRDEKIGAGVAYFFIGRTADDTTRTFPVKKTDIGIWIHRSDDSRVDFSYLSAIRNPMPASYAKEGLRVAANDARIKYRDARFAAATPVLCDISGDPISDTDASRVVYLAPTWGQLTWRFAQSEGGWDKLKVHSGRGGIQIGSRLEDAAMEKRWQAFHDKYAQLSIATIRDGARRPRGDDNAWTPQP